MWVNTLLDTPSIWNLTHPQSGEFLCSLISSNVNSQLRLVCRNFFIHACYTSITKSVNPQNIIVMLSLPAPYAALPRTSKLPQ